MRRIALLIATITALAIPTAAHADGALGGYTDDPDTTLLAVLVQCVQTPSSATPSPFCVALGQALSQASAGGSTMPAPPPDQGGISG
jgi:hypothetical protein